MTREDVVMGMAVLAPEAAFHLGSNISIQEPTVRCRITRVITRWLGEPSLVAVVAVDGREGRCNVHYLEELS